MIYKINNLFLYLNYLGFIALRFYEPWMFRAPRSLMAFHSLFESPNSYYYEGSQ
jgi:hypothetical protein